MQRQTLYSIRELGNEMLQKENYPLRTGTMSIRNAMREIVNDEKIEDAVR